VSNGGDERGGLTHAGLGETDDIATIEYRSDCLGLNGARLVVAHVLEISHQQRVEFEISK